MAVTARDVAKAAGVSPATASLVFRGKPGVGRETRKRVLSIARDMGFEYETRVPTQKTSTILLVIYKRSGQVVGETPFFEELIKGVSDATYRSGYHRLSISYFYAQQSASEQIKSLRSVKCSGIILLATEMLSVDVSQFERLGVPIVILDNWFPTKPMDSVVIDNQHGAWEASRYLISKGHTNIGYLHSKVEIRNFLERRVGWHSAVQGVIETEGNPNRFIARVGSTTESAYHDMLAYLDTNPDLPTAYFADNDVIAEGCIRAMQERGIRIPEDVSVVGFDDAPMTELVNPPLTTMSVPKAAMGALAVKRLVTLIQGDTLGEAVRISVLPKVVERESVKPLEVKLPRH
jgi:LacI family transcriptional regulator